MAKSAARKIVKDAVIVIGGILILWIGLQIAFGTTNPFYVVSSESMVPELEVYDILIVQARVPFESIKIGDIIVFDRPVGEPRVIVHRVQMVIDDDPYTLQTKGDANKGVIPGTDFPITETEYIGKVQYVVPQAGFITQIFAPPVNYILIGIVIGFIILRALKKNKKDTPPPRPGSLPSDSTYTSGDGDGPESGDRSGVSMRRDPTYTSGDGDGLQPQDAGTSTDKAQAPQDAKNKDRQ